VNIASKNPQSHEQKNEQSPKSPLNIGMSVSVSVVATGFGDSLGSKIVRSSQPGRFNTTVKVSNQVNGKFRFPMFRSKIGP
jgi:hypothetical protein